MERNTSWNILWIFRHEIEISGRKRLHFVRSISLGNYIRKPVSGVTVNASHQWLCFLWRLEVHATDRRMCLEVTWVGLQGCTQKFPDWVDNERYAYNNKHSLGSNTKGYGGKTHSTGSQNSDTTAPSGRKLYHCSSRSRQPVRKLLDTSSYIATIVSVILSYIA
jgi:hypothetical protein